MPPQPEVSGLSATMTTMAMGLGVSVTVGDTTILSSNLAQVSRGLRFSPAGASFLASLATLTLAAAVLGAGALGDRYGMKRMYVAGACGAIVFGLLGAAAPSQVLLLGARAGIGLAFAFLLGLSLAIINAVFPPERRVAAIGGYLAAGYAFAVFQPVLGSWLASHYGWRAGLLITPGLAALTLLLVLRYVPETARSQRRFDVVGILLIAAGLVLTIYGLSDSQIGFNVHAGALIMLGLAVSAAFVFWELRTEEPALDMRVFRSGRFNAAVIAGATFNFLQGGSTVLFAYYLVTLRSESPELLGVLLVPAMVLATLAAGGAGRVAAWIGDRAVVVAGLVILLVGVLLLSALDVGTPVAVLSVAVALNAVGRAVVQTPQSNLRYDRDARPHMAGNQVGRASLLKVAAARAAYAEHATGRNSRPTNERLAADTGLSVRTVQRADAALKLLGVATEVMRGRQRTRVERMASWRVGDRGRGWASVWALHDDAALARAVSLLSPHPEGSLLREKPSGLSVLTTSGRRPSGSGGRGAKRRASPDSGGSRLAARWRTDPTSPPWARRHSVHAWAAVLAAPAAARWSSRDLNTAIRDWAGVHKWLPDTPHRPIGLLGAILRWHGDTAVRPAALDEAREAAELATARERVCAQLAAREQMAAQREAGRAALDGAGHAAARAAVAAATVRAVTRRTGAVAAETARRDPRRPQVGALALCYRPPRAWAVVPDRGGRADAAEVLGANGIRVIARLRLDSLGSRAAYPRPLRSEPIGPHRRTEPKNHSPHCLSQGVD